MTQNTDIADRMTLLLLSDHLYLPHTHAMIRDHRAGRFWILAKSKATLFHHHSEGVVGILPCRQFSHDIQLQRSKASHVINGRLQHFMARAVLNTSTSSSIVTKIFHSSLDLSVRTGFISTQEPLAGYQIENVMAIGQR
jgi:hypothetical protein